MVKKVIVTFLLLVTSLFSQEIEWAKDFKTGVDMAKKEVKPIMFISSRHTCKYCVILDNTTLKDEKVIKALNKNFVSIISYSDENDYIPKALWSPGTPTIWFLYPDGNPMFKPIPGALGAKDFYNALEIVKKEFDKLKKDTAKK